MANHQRYGPRARGAQQASEMLSVVVRPPPPSVRVVSVAMAPVLAVIMGIDWRLRGSEGLLSHGAVDATAHVLTALVILSAIRTLGMKVNWVVGAVGAIIADAEYLLIVTDAMAPLGDSARGPLHTLGPVLGVLIVGLLWPTRRVFCFSLGIGMLTHILRDSATAATAALWPISYHVVHLRYSYYLATLIACTVIVTGMVALSGRRQ